MKWTKRHIISVTAKLILPIAILLLLAHGVFPHQHGTTLSTAKTVYKHPQEQNVLHFVLNLLSTDTGIDHLEYFCKSSATYDIDIILPPQLCMIPYSENVVLNVLLHEEVHTVFFGYSNVQRGPPSIV